MSEPSEVDAPKASGERERQRDPSVRRLLAVMDALRLEYDAIDAVDALWLARFMPSSTPDREEARPFSTPERAKEGEARVEPGETKPPGASPPSPGPSPSPIKRHDGSGKVARPETSASASVFAVARPSESARVGRGKVLWAPVPRALADPLGIARALRPLMRRAASRQRWMLDVDATVERTAEEGFWQAMLRPELERWLDLSLVVDTSPSMDVWRPTVRELKRLLEHMGVFNRVTTWGWDSAADAQALHPGTSSRVGPSATRDPFDLARPDGRHLILLATDCVSEAWHDGAAAAYLEYWAERGPVALLQMFPESLWSRTALGGAPSVLLSAAGAAAPNAELPLEPSRELAEIDPSWRFVPVPVLTTDPVRIKRWARVVAGTGRSVVLGRMIPLPTAAVQSAPTPEEAGPEPEKRLRRFRLASEEASVRLARLLAAAPVITLPVLRILSRSPLGRGATTTVNEAEVLLGGLIHPISTGPTPALSDLDPDEVLYDFAEGVRDLLLDAMPARETLEVLRTIDTYIEQHLGLEPGAVRTILADPRPGGVALPVSEKPLARVLTHVLRRLGGDHADLAIALEEAWDAPPEPVQPARETRPEPAKPSRKVRILHLADLRFHASAHHAPRRGEDEFTKVLDRYRAQGRAPDLIAITGNIGTGPDESYQHAQRWIDERLLPGMAEPRPERILVIPGDRDVSISELEGDEVDRFAELAGEIEAGGPVSPDAQDELHRLALSTHGPYVRFQQRLNETIHPNVLSRGRFVDVRGDEIGVVCLASSLLSPRSPGQTSRYIGDHLIDQAFEMVNDRPRIVLSHAPLDKLRESDRIALIAAMRRSGCPVLLHGLTRGIVEQTRGEPWPWLTIGAFTLLEGSSNESTFNFVELDADGPRVVVESWSWDDSAGRWKPLKPRKFDLTGSKLRPRPKGPSVTASIVRDSLVGLRRWAQVAAAARGLRRVVPLFEAAWPQAPREGRQALERAIELVEHAASAASPRPPGTSPDADKRLERLAIRLAELRTDIPADDAAPPVDARRRVLIRVVATARQLLSILDTIRSKKYRLAEEESQLVIELLVKVIEAAGDAAPGDPTRAGLIPESAAASFWEAALDDIGRLRRAQDDRGWDHDTPVRPSFFGDLWPEGPPEGWPAERALRVAPKAAELSVLPRWALLAYVARCVRRGLAAAPTERALAEIVRRAEHTAATGEGPGAAKPEEGGKGVASDADPIVARATRRGDTLLANAARAVGCLDALSQLVVAFDRERLDRLIGTLSQASIDFLYATLADPPRAESAGWLEWAKEIVFDVVRAATYVRRLTREADLAHDPIVRAEVKQFTERLSRPWNNLGLIHEAQGESRWRALVGCAVEALDAVLAVTTERDPDAELAMRRDLQRLREVLGDRPPTDLSTVSPEVFGPLRPEDAEASQAASSGTEAPRWVLVDDCLAEIGRKSHRNFRKRLGAALARANFGLMVSSLSRVSGRVESGYELERSRLGRGGTPPAQGVQRPRLTEIDAEGNMVETSDRTSVRHAEFLASLRQAHAILLVGGDPASRELLILAREHGKPLLPLAVTGPRAERVFDAMRDDWDAHPVPGLSRDEFLLLGGAMSVVLERLPTLLKKAIDASAPTGPDASGAPPPEVGLGLGLGRGPGTDDPQKNRWGGSPSQNGRVLKGTVTRRDDGTLFDVTLEVASIDPGKPLTGSVVFHLHPTFNPPRTRVFVRNGRAELSLVAYRAFTLGAELDEPSGRTRLELDLASGWPAAPASPSTRSRTATPPL